MEISGWGRYPRVEASQSWPGTSSQVVDLIRQASSPMISRGLGRSYGDSALAAHVLCTSYLDHFLEFDAQSGLLTCASGVSLASILELVVPQGWFLAVTPGTKFVSVGGAIASDVHGKNHHGEGTFGEYVTSLRVATVSEGVLECSRQQHSDLFRATCGGMGLTGTILSATLQLKQIGSSLIRETTLKATNLEEALQLFEENNSATYSVAWIDCLASGADLGRSLIMLGEHVEAGALTCAGPARLAVPFDTPGFLLNRYSIQAMNTLYYHRVRTPRSTREIHYDPYFYPLDSIHHWNRLYGSEGFLQYQFVLPREAGLEGMTIILKQIASSGMGSFLAVLKAMGPENSNYLSFPLQGYTLALDFKNQPGLHPLLARLDDIVMSYGGRNYLAKDARMTEHFFKSSYPNWEQFAEVRARYGADRVFHSLQSQRLGI